MTSRHQTTRCVFTFITNYYAEHGFGPTHREIAEGCFIARSGVLGHLMKLEAWECITVESGKARSLRPLKSVNDLEAILKRRRKK